MLPCLVSVLLTFKIQDVLKFEKNPSPKGQTCCIISIFSLQNAVYFIMLPCLVSLLLTFKIQGVLKFEKNIRRQKVKFFIYLRVFLPSFHTSLISL